MEKHILRWSYWLGVACFAIAVVWGGLHEVGISSGAEAKPGGIGYMTFYKAGLLFLLTAIATANYAWGKGQKP